LPRVAPMSLADDLRYIRDLEHRVDNCERLHADYEELSVYVNSLGTACFEAAPHHKKALVQYLVHGKKATVAAVQDLIEGNLKLLKENRVLLFKACQDLANQSEE
jgi:hypothetical protein